MDKSSVNIVAKDLNTDIINKEEVNNLDIHIADADSNKIEKLSINIATEDSNKSKTAKNSNISIIGIKK